jgi:hypothetical protein
MFRLSRRHSCPRLRVKRRTGGSVRTEGGRVSWRPLTLVAAVAAGLLQAAQAGRAYIQPSCQERKHPLGPMQELGAFACGPPVVLLPIS